MERRAPMSSSGDTSIGSPTRAHHQQLAVDAESGDDRAHALGVGHRGEDHFRAAELGQLLGHVLRGAVDIDLGAELLGQGSLVGAARDRHGLESHLGRELHAEVTQAADAEDRDEIARTRAAVAQRIEGGDARAQSSGAASSDFKSSGIEASASNGAIMYSA